MDMSLGKGRLCSKIRYFLNLVSSLSSLVSPRPHMLSPLCHVKLRAGTSQGNKGSAFMSMRLFTVQPLLPLSSLLPSSYASIHPKNAIVITHIKHLAL